MTSPLDTIETYRRLDPTDLYGRIVGLPRQMRDAWAAAQALTLPHHYADSDAVMVLGMGGSGIGGALLRALALHLKAPTPVEVVRGYTLPAYVDKRWLVIASSNSGNTEETVAAFEQASASGAHCIAITSGGRLGDLAREANVPVLAVDWPHEPRAGLGWSFASLAAIASRLHLIPDVTPMFAPALEHMESLIATAASDVPESANPAKQLAKRWYNGLPVTLAADALVPIAYRWSTQINENGKSWAVAGELSEFNHNAPVGYPIPSTVVPHLRVTLLSHAAVHLRNALRIDLSAEQMRASGVDVNIVDVHGDDVLQQMLWAVQLGDLASYYLGLLYEQDPSEVRALDWLKTHLAQSP